MGFSFSAYSQTFSLKEHTKKLTNPVGSTDTLLCPVLIYNTKYSMV